MNEILYWIEKGCGLEIAFSKHFLSAFTLINLHTLKQYIWYHNLKLLQPCFNLFISLCRNKRPKAQFGSFDLTMREEAVKKRLDLQNANLSSRSSVWLLKLCKERKEWARIYDFNLFQSYSLRERFIQFPEIFIFLKFNVKNRSALVQAILYNSHIM